VGSTPDNHSSNEVGNRAAVESRHQLDGPNGRCAIAKKTQVALAATNDAIVDASERSRLPRNNEISANDQMGLNKVTRRGFLKTSAIGAAAAIVGEKAAGAAITKQTWPEVPPDDGKSLGVALLQMNSAITNPAATSPWESIVVDAASVREHQDKNLSIADAACRQAAALGADIALFPEMWNIGYAVFDGKKPNAKESWQELAIGTDSVYVQHFVSLARELNMAICLTYLQKWRPAPRNVVSVVSRTGEIVLTYAKVHTCDFMAEAAVCPGDEFPVSELATRFGPVKVGCMTCYDFQFPESARILMLNGAELILVPVATGLPEIYSDQVKIRAYDNAVAVAVANYANLPFDGNSVAYDALGRRLVEPVSGGTECVQIARINLEKTREIRKTTLMGNAFRRPRKYKRLISDDLDPVFSRADFFGQPFDRQTR
jgi:predicted amidohydrolase